MFCSCSDRTLGKEYKSTSGWIMVSRTHPGCATRSSLGLITWFHSRRAPQSERCWRGKRYDRVWAAQGIPGEGIWKDYHGGLDTRPLGFVYYFRIRRSEIMVRWRAWICKTKEKVAHSCPMCMSFLFPLLAWSCLQEVCRKLCLTLSRAKSWLIHRSLQLERLCKYWKVRSLATLFCVTVKSTGCQTFVILSPHWYLMQAQQN